MNNRPPIYRSSPPPLPRPDGAPGPMQPRNSPQRPSPILFAGVAVAVLLLLIFAWLLFTVVDQQIAKNRDSQAEANNSSSQQDGKVDLEKTELEKTELEKTETEKVELEKTETETETEKVELEKTETEKVEDRQRQDRQRQDGQGQDGQGQDGQAQDGQAQDGQGQDKRGYVLPYEQNRKMANRPGDPSSISFFRHVVAAKSVAYVIDCSASMDEKLPAGQTRLERAKQELLNSVYRLDQNQAFTVFFYDTKAYFEQELMEISPTPANLEALSKWVATNYAAGAKDPLPALNKVFQGDCEVVFLLSDGEFDAGTAREVRRMNLQNIPIYTVTFGANNASLEKISAANGGKHVVVTN